MHGSDAGRKKVAVFLIAGALCCLSLAAISQLVEMRRASDGRVSGQVFPKLKAQLRDLSAIDISSSHETYRLTKSTSGWILPQKAHYPVDAQKLEGFAQALARLRFVSKRTADPLDYQALGLGAPEQGGAGVSVRLLNSKNQTLAHVIYTTRGKASLVRRPPDPQVFEVNAALPEARFAKNWLATQALEITPERIGSVTVTLKGEIPYSIVRRPDDGFAPVGGTANVAATSTAIALSNIHPIDVKADSSATGLQIGVHEVSLRGGMTIRITGFQEGNAHWISISAIAAENQPDTEAAKLNAVTGGRFFQIDATSFQSLFTPRSSIFSSTAKP